MAWEASQQAGQSRSVTRRVVDPTEQDALGAHAPASDGHMTAAVLEQLIVGL